MTIIGVYRADNGDIFVEDNELSEDLFLVEVGRGRTTVEGSDGLETLWEYDPEKELAGLGAGSIVMTDSYNVVTGHKMAYVKTADEFWAGTNGTVISEDVLVECNFTVLWKEGV